MALVDNGNVYQPKIYTSKSRLNFIIIYGIPTNSKSKTSKIIHA